MEIATTPGERICVRRTALSASHPSLTSAHSETGKASRLPSKMRVLARGGAYPSLALPVRMAVRALAGRLGAASPLWRLEPVRSFKDNTTDFISIPLIQTVTTKFTKFVLGTLLCLWVSLSLRLPANAAVGSRLSLLDETAELVKENFVGEVPQDSDFEILKEMARERAFKRSLLNETRMVKPGTVEWERNEVAAYLSLLNDPFTKHLAPQRFDTKIMSSGGAQFALGCELKKTFALPIALAPLRPDSHSLRPDSQAMVSLAATEVVVSGAVRRSRGRWVPVLTGGLAAANYSKATLSEQGLYPTVVESVVPGSAADESGLRVGDRILAIDSQPHRMLDLGTVNDAFMATERASTSQSKKLARGQQVTLDVLSRSARKRERLTVTPKMQIRSTIDWRVENGQGIMRISSISRETSEEMERAFQEMGDISQLILDLRGNCGGNLAGAAEIASLFLSPGSEVVKLEAKSGQVTTLKTEEPRVPMHKVPLLVFTDQNTASSAEIIAGCLKDHGRGVLIGSEKTYGKGVAQRLFNLPDGSGIALSILKIRTPHGHEISGAGIKPHRIVHGGAPSLDKFMEECIVNSDSWKQSGVPGS